MTTCICGTLPLLIPAYTAMLFNLNQCKWIFGKHFRSIWKSELHECGWIVHIFRVALVVRRLETQAAIMTTNQFK